MGRRLALCAMLGALLVLAACSGSQTSDDSSPSPSATVTSPTAPAAPTASAPGRYVALGDSYTAGPGIDPQQTNAGYCARSTKNWPSVVSASLGDEITDLSCSGATTADLSSTLGSGAVPAGANLVTISAGGNDGGLFLSLIRECSTGSAACGTFVRDQAPAILAQTTSDLTALLTKTATTVPDADVVVVGYPRIMPDGRTCTAVGIPAADVDTVVAAETSLDTALASAAERAGVEYVSLRAASDGHDACAGDQAWTNGTSPTAGDGIVFHPNARGMKAVGDLVAAALKDG